MSNVDDVTGAEDERGHRPAWFRFAPFLGRAPALTRRQWRVLGLVSIVSLFEQYDVYLFALNLKRIQADLAIAEASLGLLGSLVRAGALLAFPVALMADRLGRRRVLLFTILAYTLCTGATALAPNAMTFVAFQFLARVFAAAETVIAVVVVAEEFDAAHRGWGVGALGALQACGAGLAALAFGFVDRVPFGWRSLFALGLVPLVLVAYLRRSLSETTRFLELSRAAEPSPATATSERIAPGSGARGPALRAAPALAPVVALARSYPGRIVLLALSVIAFEVAAGPALFFAPKFLEDVHGFHPAQIAALNIVGGALAIVGNPLAGRLSDRFGRRPVTAAFALGAVAAVATFYLWRDGAVWPLWIAQVFAIMGTGVTLATYGAELFPTPVRSTASGLRELCRHGAGALGLALVSLLYAGAGSNWTAIAWLAVVALVTPALVLLAFPETAGRPLEEIA
jgi:putative MFS transporter